MNYEIISSGSKGNATIINGFMLIDCGVSFAKLKNYYKKLSVILLTHIHTDHFNKSAIKKIAFNKPTIKFVCGEWLVKDLIECGVKKQNINIVDFNNTYNFNTFILEPVLAYHDVPNCGYKIEIEDKKLIYITDTCSIDHIEAKEFDYYLIEGNYENEEELQKRIELKKQNNIFVYETRVSKTHLSKEKALKYFLENAKDESELIYMHETTCSIKELECKENE